MACGLLRFDSTSLRAYASGDIHDDLEEEEKEYLEKVREHYRKKDEEYGRYRKGLDHRRKQKEETEGSEESEDDEFSLSINDLEKNTGIEDIPNFEKLPKTIQELLEEYKEEFPAGLKVWAAMDIK